MESQYGEVDELECRELVELVTDYLEGDLPPPERARFESHLAECDDCRAYLLQMRASVGALARLGERALTVEEQGRLVALFRRFRDSVAPGDQDQVG